MILTRFKQENPLDSLTSVLESKALLALQEVCRSIYVEQSLRDYIVAISRATRGHKDVKLGASPRATQGMQSASQALAAIRGRDHVLPDDIKHLAVSVLSHRLIAKTEARLRGHSAESIIEEILSTVPVPVEN